MTLEIRLVPQAEIDRLKWDSCVHFANNGNPYAYSWYLNNIAKEWDGLVEGDYISVMPLLHRKNKTGHQELYQPDLIPFSGVYSVRLLTKSRLQAFLGAIPDFYKKIDIKTPNIGFSLEEFDFEHQVFDNYQLMMDQDWQIIKNDYSQRVQKLLLGLEGSGLYPGNALKIEEIAALYTQFSSEKQKEKKAHAYQRILYNVMHRGTGFNPVILNQAGETCAAGAFVYSHGKIICLLYVQKPGSEGEMAGAYLHDLLIEKHAGKPIILDFNPTSGNPWGAAFGAKAIPHHQLSRNQLPWWSKMMGN